jgi:hypothetical protein
MITINFSSLLRKIVELWESEGQKWVSALPVDRLTTPPVCHCDHNKINAAAVTKLFYLFKIRYTQ